MTKRANKKERYMSGSSLFFLVLGLMCAIAATGCPENGDDVGGQGNDGVTDATDGTGDEATEATDEETDEETDDVTTLDDTGVESGCPADAKCCDEAALPKDEVDCKDENGQPIPDCMAYCGPAVSWSSGFDCPAGLRCADAGCYDTDGADGYCFPEEMLACETAEDCDCLPTPCGDPIAWTCRDGFCDAETLAD